MVTSNHVLGDTTTFVEYPSKQLCVDYHHMVVLSLGGAKECQRGYQKSITIYKLYSRIMFAAPASFNTEPPVPASGSAVVSELDPNGYLTFRNSFIYQSFSFSGR